MAMGIFEQLDWLTKTVKKLCCKTDFAKLSVYGSNNEAIDAGLVPGDLYRNNDGVLYVVYTP